MKRRTLLKALPLGLLPLAGESVAWLELISGKCCSHDPVVPENPKDETYKLEEQTPGLSVRHRESSHSVEHDTNHTGHNAVDLQKIKEFDQQYPGDFLLNSNQLELLKKVSARLQVAQSYIGHGNFNLVTFDHLLMCGEHYPAIGAFSAQELYFIEDIFYADATRYGFYGQRVTPELTAIVQRRDIKKIGRTGHFLFRGQPLQKYQSIRAELGSGITLTSGIRGIVKQTQLFLAKAVVTNGNLSQASRSLAPPGYSYHGIGDFDLGKVGFGLRNFTESFATTDEYKRLIDLGYVSIRYTETNPFGVRHEPWHIKIV
ncbi:MAG: M15 family metallopeptidase [Pseudomonadales bacterium]